MICPTHRHSNRGFTIIELLVVVLLLGILVALILPAVQAAREAARSTACSNNMHQIGLAIHSYIQSANTFPLCTENGYSFLARILPGLEQPELYNSINFSTEYLNASNISPSATLSSIVVSVFICPSDRMDYGSKHAGTNYAGSRGIGRGAPVDTGVFNSRSPNPFSLSDVRDGASGTAMVAEWLRGPPRPSLVDPRSTIFDISEQAGTSVGFETFVSNCHAIDPANAKTHANNKGSDWLAGGYYFTLYNHIMCPNDYSCVANGQSRNGAYTAASSHRKGAYLLFCDGHTQFITDSVSVGTWRAMATINSGDSVGF